MNTYDARRTARNPQLVPVFLAPPAPKPVPERTVDGPDELAAAIAAELGRKVDAGDP